MSGTYNENLDETDDQPDSFEVEGIQAFNRLAAAVTGLESRLGVLEHGLGSKATQAERAASTAATPLRTPSKPPSTSRPPHGLRRDPGPPTPPVSSWQAPSPPAASATCSANRPGKPPARRPATGPPWTRTPPRAGPTPRPDKPPSPWTGREASIGSRAAMGRAGRSSSRPDEGPATRTLPQTGKSTAGLCLEPATSDLNRKKGARCLCLRAVILVKGVSSIKCQQSQVTLVSADTVIVLVYVSGILLSILKL